MRALLAGLAGLVTGCADLLDIPDVHRGDCSPDAEFTELALVRGLGDGAIVQSAQLSRDERTIIFGRNTYRGDVDLFIAHRDAPDDAFGNVAALEELNSEQDELTGSLSDDLQTLYFDRQLAPRHYQIFTAQRTVGGRFTAATPVALGETPTSDFEPFITAGGLYFSSTRDAGMASLFYADGRDTAFAQPHGVMAEQRASKTAYETPVVSADGRTIYYTALHAVDNVDVGDVWTASRADATLPFGTARPVPSINNGGINQPAWSSEDRCRLYFVTNRGTSAWELWLASRRAR